MTETQERQNNIIEDRQQPERVPDELVPTQRRLGTGENKNQDDLDLSEDHNHSQTGRAPFIQHQGSWNRLSCTLLVFGIVLLLGGMLLLLTFLLGGCKQISGQKLKDSLGFSCCRQVKGATQGIPLCQSKFYEAEALGFLICGILSIAFSFVLMVYSRKYFYSLNYAFFDWK